MIASAMLLTTLPALLASPAPDAFRHDRLRQFETAYRASAPGDELYQREWSVCDGARRGRGLDPVLTRAIISYRGPGARELLSACRFYWRQDATFDRKPLTSPRD